MCKTRHRIGNENRKETRTQRAHIGKKRAYGCIRLKKVNDNELKIIAGRKYIGDLQEVSSKTTG